MSESGSAQVCPRCGYATIEVAARSQVPGVWEVLSCTRCTYLWRTTEPARTSTRAAYPERYRWTAQLIKDAPAVPAIVEPVR
jgi:vanillate/4-hydroxybenzoate decarboxylase subunit D